MSEPGTRTALALSGPALQDLGRGQTVVHPDRAWASGQLLDVELELAPGAPALPDRSRVRFHLGTAEVMARVQMARGGGSGERRPCRLRLEAPVVARGGDRFVIRTFSPVTVIGGGVVLDPLPVNRRGAGLPSRDAEGYLECLVARRRWGVTPAELAVLSGSTPDEVEAGIAASHLVRAGAALLTSQHVTRLAARLAQAVARHHQQAPTEPGISAETLRRSLGAPDDIANAALRLAVEEGSLEERLGLVVRKGFAPRPATTDAELALVLAILEREGLAAPPVAELVRQAGANALPALRVLEGRGLVVAVQRDTYVTSVALTGFRATLELLGVEGTITPARVRDATGLSRKYLIPLLEWADRAGLTVREGEGRRLSRRMGAGSA